MVNRNNYPFRLANPLEVQYEVLDKLVLIWNFINTGGIMAVNLRDNVKPISYIKTNAADMMKYVNERKSPIIITQKGEARAVLMDIETYQETEDAFALMNIIKLAEDDIKNGRVKKAEDVFGDLRKKITTDN
jgi:prevent-host-death family protein